MGRIKLLLFFFSDEYNTFYRIPVICRGYRFFVYQRLLHPSTSAHRPPTDGRQCQSR